MSALADLSRMAGTTGTGRFATVAKRPILLKYSVFGKALAVGSVLVSSPPTMANRLRKAYPFFKRTPGRHLRLLASTTLPFVVDFAQWPPAGTHRARR